MPLLLGKELQRLVHVASLNPPLVSSLPPPMGSKSSPENTSQSSAGGPGASPWRKEEGLES